MAKEEKQSEQKTTGEAKSSGMKLPIMIGIIVGILVVNAAIIYFLFNLLLAPSISNQHGEPAKKEKQADEETKLEEEFDESHKPVFVETGRITTNPKFSDKFVVVNLGLEVKSKEHSNELEPALLAKIRGVVNSTFANMTVDEIHSRRDSLDIIFLNNLKPVFKKEKKLLSEVIIQEFIIQ